MTKRITIILAAFIIVFLNVNSTYADAPSCPADQNQVVAVSGPHLPDAITNASDMTSTVIDVTKRIEYPSGDRERKVPGDGDTVSFAVEYKFSNNSTLFTQIYANFLSMLPAFITADSYHTDKLLEGNPQKKKLWDRYYCMQGLDDKTEASVSTNVSGSITYRIQVNRPTDETSDAPECQPPVPEPADWSPPPGCIEQVDNWETEEKSLPLNETPNPGVFQVPYGNGLRELARKVAAVIKEQYCSTTGPNMCMVGYNCLSFEKLFIDPEYVKYDPAAKGKDGLCMALKEDTTTGQLVPTVNSNDENIVNIMCTDIRMGNTDLGTLKSNICYYPQKLTLTQNIPSFPRLSTGNVDDTTNSIPFDTDLFKDNGEPLNENCYGKDPSKCNPDGFFRRAFVNKLALYQGAEQKWYKDLPGYMDVAGKIYDADKVNNTGYYKDVIENLGEYLEISNDARFLNPSLQPSGHKANIDKGNLAYIRSVNNSRNGILFVNGHPIGALPFGSSTDKPNISVGYPSIFTQYGSKKYVVAAIAENGNVYASISGEDGSPAKMFAVNGLNDSFALFRIQAVMNKSGNILIATNNGPSPSMRYVIRSGGNFSGGENFTPQSSSKAAISLDEFDNLFVIGTPDSEHMGNVLYYSKFSFAGPGLDPKIVDKPIIMPGSIAGYGTQSFSIAPDLMGGAVIAINVQHNENWWENDIYYVHIDASGTVVTQEIGVDRNLDKMQGYPAPDDGSYIGVNHMLLFNGPNIARLYDPVRQEFATYMVYKKSVYYQIGKEKKINSVAYARRGSDGKWIQDVSLSERLHDLYSDVDSVNIDATGGVVFAMADNITRYDRSRNLMDAAGFKYCKFESIFKLLGENRNCGLITPTTKYIIPPTQNGGQMSFGDLPRYY